MSSNGTTPETTTNILKIMSDKSLIDALHAFLSEYQLAFIVALGVVGFLTVIGLSTSKSPKSTKKKTTKKTPATPKRTPSKTEAAATRMAAKKGAAGSVETPAGRRSARIARKKVEK